MFKELSSDQRATLLLTSTIAINKNIASHALTVIYIITGFIISLQTKSSIMMANKEGTSCKRQRNGLLLTNTSPINKTIAKPVVSSK